MRPPWNRTERRTDPDLVLPPCWFDEPQRDDCRLHPLAKPFRGLRPRGLMTRLAGAPARNEWRSRGRLAAGALGRAEPTVHAATRPRLRLRTARADPLEWQ